MKFEAELACQLREVGGDNIQCGNLLGHEKHAFAFGQALGNEIGDGLALPVPGGPMSTSLCLLPQPSLPS